MNFNKISADVLSQIKTIVGKDAVLIMKDDLHRYSHDETEDLHFYPEVVVKPENTSQVSQLLKLCNENLIPVTPRGGGTGLSGGALPVYGGLLLSMERFNSIIEIDECNLQAGHDHHALLDTTLYIPKRPCLADF